MSSVLIDPYKAAKKGASLNVRIAPEEMPRLAEVVRKLSEISAEVEFFWDQQKRLRVDGHISTEIEVPCERCLELMPMVLDVAVNAAVVRTEEQASQLSADLDPWMGENEQLNLHRMLEDELLLALPIMPAHELENCKGRSSYSTEPKIELSERRKPFAGLASLINSTDD